jgi:serine/threonine protein kinase
MIGERLGNYEIRELLGEGAAGNVYLARHTQIANRVAAIKVLHKEYAKKEAMVDRFLNEADIVNSIHHPNIIDIWDKGKTEYGVPYLVMECLKGTTLTNRIRVTQGGRLGVEATVKLGIQMTAPLFAAHNAGVIHRDIKPDNLFVVRDPSDPNGELIKVLDFGIAKLRADVFGTSVKTEQGETMGSRPYMSPEQLLAKPDIDRRADIYSLGIVLYEMLCATTPFDPDFVTGHLYNPPPPPSTKNPEIPAALEHIILKALEKEPDKRFQTMQEMQNALGAVRSHRSLAMWRLSPARSNRTQPDPSPPTDDAASIPRRTIPRLPVGVFGGAAVLAAIAILVMRPTPVPADHTQGSSAPSKTGTKEIAASGTTPPSSEGSAPVGGAALGSAAALGGGATPGGGATTSSGTTDTVEKKKPTRPRTRNHHRVEPSLDPEDLDPPRLPRSGPLGSTSSSESELDPPRLR